jgi:hypothetical protein
LLLDVFNRCFMCSFSTLAISCPEHARLEVEYLQARDRMRNFLTGSREAAGLLGKVTRVSRFAAGTDEEERLAVQMAMAIARLKEHIAAHGCER